MRYAVDPNMWQWPQYFTLVAAFLGLAIAAGCHGESRSPHSFPVSVVAVLIGLFVQWAGGWWG